MSLPARDNPRTGALGAAAAALLAAGAGAAAFLAAAILAPARPAPPRAPPALFRAHDPGAGAWATSAARVYAEVDRRMRRGSAAARARVARTVLDEARRAGVDPLLVTAVIHVESSFDPRAVSPVGAVGLMQLMVPTLAEEATRGGLSRGDPFDAVANVRAGVRYLARLERAFGDLELALMAYNAGPGRIRGHLRAGGVPARFHVYPRRVTREVARLREPLPPPHVRLAKAEAEVAAPAARRAVADRRAAAPAARLAIAAGAGAPAAPPPRAPLGLAVPDRQRLRMGRRPGRRHARPGRATRRPRGVRGGPRTGRRRTGRPRGVARAGRVR